MGIQSACLEQIFVFAAFHDVSMEELSSRLTLTADEASFDENSRHLPVKITEYFFSLINPNDPDDPLRKEVVPTRFEETTQTYEALDPLEEVNHSVTSRLIHRYPSRVAFLVTDLCPMYCRHCFRRRFTGTFQGPATDAEILEAATYCGNHPEVTEILLTGGDMADHNFFVDLLWAVRPLVA